VQGDGTVGVLAVWRTAAAWGSTTVTGLATGTPYTFAAKARNGDGTETALGLGSSGRTHTVLRVVAAPMLHVQAPLDRYPEIGAGWTVHLAPGVYSGNVHPGGNHGGLVIEGAGDGGWYDPAVPAASSRRKT
jgi:hypothetical protein